MIKIGLISLLGFTWIGLTGCGPCKGLNRLFDDPSCHNLQLSASRNFTLSNGTCITTNNRKVSISCPPTAGSYSQCTSISNQFPVFVILVPNNQNGNFVDADGTVYSNCNALIPALNNNAITNLAGYYFSDNSTANNTLNCTDTGGCNLPLSGACVTGWNTATRSPQGTATLTNGTKLLSCVYIFNTNSDNTNPNITVGDWNSSMTPLTISGNIVFGSSANWVDAAVSQ